MEARENKTSSKESGYLLEVRNLKKHFLVSKNLAGANRKYLRAVDGISFGLQKGRTLGIVGESGCGKSTAGNTIIRLLEPTEGEILFEGRDLARLTEKEIRPIRGDIQMIFQDPYSSLNPRMRVFDIIAESFRTHGTASGSELREKVYALMDVVSLSRSYGRRYPHEFSGGQRQRIGIARALALNPKLIICDEPVSALDVSIQAQILNLLKELQRQFGLTYIFIAHGLPVIQYISDQIAVMYLGVFVELASNTDLFGHPLHPYTGGLLAAIPIPDPSLRSLKNGRLLEGDPPNPINLPAGCRFHPRCRYATGLCSENAPEFRELFPGHFVACHHPCI